MQHLRGTLVNYPWGTFDVIPTLLGEEPDGRPVAEFWLGAHPLSPSDLGDTPLDEALADTPALLGEATAAEYGNRLPFLLKVLSARHALSIQAHPDRAQAEEGFASEEAAGIPRTAPERTYRDDWPKPEILIALEEFHTLVGFRDPHVTAALFRALDAGPDAERLLAPLVARGGQAALQEVFLDVLALGDDPRRIIDQVLAAAVRHRNAGGTLGVLARTALQLDDTFPADPGILAALLMNHVVLQPGQALYLPAGRMHAHLRGTGIEVMATSDNVLRGGLTTKHIAVDELVKVVDFSWVEPEILSGTETAPGVWAYPTPCPEFDVWRLELVPGRTVTLPADTTARIALVTRGDAAFVEGDESMPAPQGSALFVAAGRSGVQVTGDAQLFVGAAGVR